MNIIGLMCFVVLFADSSVITLMKDNNITCVLTDRHRNRTVYLNSSPQVQFTNVDRISIGKWIENDWNSDKLSLFLPLMNQRWHDIPTTNEIKERIDIENSATSFSMCTQGTVKLIVEDEFTGINNSRPPIFIMSSDRTTEEACSWRHFMAMPFKGGMDLNELNFLNVSSQYEIINKEFHFSAKYLRLVNSSPTFWKVSANMTYHLWSDQANNDTDYSALLIDVSNHGLKCVSLFVSMEEGCDLNFVLECDNGDVKINRTEFGFNSSQRKRHWRKVRLSVDCNNGLGVLSFIRKANSDTNKCNETNGYWAIDHLQYEDCDKDIWSAQLSDVDLRKDNRCVLLDASIDDSAICNKSGFYGENCEFNCNGIETGCEGYKICQGNANCICSGNKYEGKCILSTKKTLSTNQPHTTKSKTLEKTTKKIDSTEQPLTTKSKATNKISSTEQSLSMIAMWFGVLLVAIVILLFFIMRHELRKLFFGERNNNYSNNQDHSNPDIEMLEFLEPEENSKIPLAKLESFIRNSLTSDHFINMFNSLPSRFDKSSLIARQKCNFIKNQDQRAIPYDESRVVLDEMLGTGEEDYINASYIDGYGKPRAYIATQTPKSLTTRDFWRMIWQQDVKLIIMATNFREKHEKKCVEYFPTLLHAHIAFGELAVRLTSVTSTECYEHRTFELNYLTDFKIVHHYQLKCTPNNQQPLYPNDLVPLVEIMEKDYEQSTTPIVIHCSSGTGKSALLILCHLALRMAISKRYLDFYGLVKQMRMSRPNMLQNIQHFILAHLVVAECLVEKERVLSNRNFNKKGLRQQMKQINICQSHDTLIKRLNNVTRERTFLLIDGYDKKHKYMPRMQPKSSSSLVEFWKLVLDHRIKLIVFIDVPKMDLWPFTTFLTESTTCSVALKESRSFSFYDVSKLILKYDDLARTVIYESEVTVVLSKNCSSKTLSPTNVETFVNLVVAVSKLKNKRHLKSPLLICDRDRVTDIGIFLSLTYVVNKYLTELIYDVENAVRILRREDSKFIENLKQLRFLQEALSLYSEKFDPYSRPE